MRLTASGQQSLHNASLRWFGSLVDDARRGGDIDLSIEPERKPEP